MNFVFVNPGVVASLVIVVIVSGNLFNYISITRYNMLLLHRLNINTILYIIKFTDKYVNYLPECEL